MFPCSRLVATTASRCRGGVYVLRINADRQRRMTASKAMTPTEQFRSNNTLHALLIQNIAASCTARAITSCYSTGRGRPSSSRFQFFTSPTALLIVMDPPRTVEPGKLLRRTRTCCRRQGGDASMSDDQTVETTRNTAGARTNGITRLGKEQNQKII
ncbi:hypothetical protein BD626DRAFT_271198 [Schizophyllum amplum]|uniref:Uncharacterized protein n=1 Tax=Schizophyllum amplum TaxID=97359 RepID=A0A550CF22_9AGAR|nr:hypothetical protein BD626DRAFT_271198 [Auriculariopsis ampla]